MFQLTYTPMTYFVNLSIKGGKNAVVERNPDSKFELTKMAKEWLIDNIVDLTNCEYWEYGDTAQLAFKFDADRLNFAKWAISLKQKGKKG